jgi:hypothetical protein
MLKGEASLGRTGELIEDTYYYPENPNLSIKIIMVDNWVTMNIILIFE